MEAVATAIGALPQGRAIGRADLAPGSGPTVQQVRPAIVLRPVALAVSLRLVAAPRPAVDKLALKAPSVRNHEAAVAMQLAVDKLAVIVAAIRECPHAAAVWCLPILEDLPLVEHGPIWAFQDNVEHWPSGTDSCRWVDLQQGMVGNAGQRRAVKRIKCSVRGGNRQ
jgi:hypothetical protein